jgi:nucleolar protein 6
MTEKLTKKQKKGLAFRQKKGKGKQQVDEELGRDVPVSENQDVQEIEHEQQPQASDEGRQPPQTDEPAKKTTSKKRKRDETVEKTEKESVEQKRPKRRKSAKAVGDGAANTEAGSSVQESGDKKKSAQRLILFVGTCILCLVTKQCSTC